MPLRPVRQTAEPGYPLRRALRHAAAAAGASAALIAFGACGDDPPVPPRMGGDVAEVARPPGAMPVALGDAGAAPRGDAGVMGTSPVGAPLSLGLPPGETPPPPPPPEPIPAQVTPTPVKPPEVQQIAMPDHAPPPPPDDHPVRMPGRAAPIRRD